MIPVAEIQVGCKYVTADRNVMRCDSLEPGYVHFTYLLHTTRPTHVGNDFICCPRWFSEQAVGVLSDDENTEEEAA